MFRKIAIFLLFCASAFAQLVPPTNSSKVPYQAPYANTYATTQAEVNSRTFNVFDWLTATERANVKAGVMANDLSAHVTNAVNAVVSAGGGTLFFPHGAYAMNNINQPRGVNFVGEEVIATSSIAHGWYPWTTSQPVWLMGNDSNQLLGVYAENITLNAIGPNGRGTTGLLSTGGLYHVWLKNISARYFSTDCIKITGGTTYASSYINFTGLNLDGDSSSGNGLNMAYGSTFLTQIVFDKVAISWSTSGHAIVSDGVQYTMSHGWVQVRTNHGLQFLKTGSNSPFMDGYSLIIENTDGNTVAVETFDNTRYTAGLIRGFIHFSGNPQIKWLDTTTGNMSQGFTRIPYQAEIFQPTVIDNLFFAENGTPLTTAQFINVASGTLWLQNNGSGSNQTALRLASGGDWTLYANGLKPVIASNGQANAVNSFVAQNATTTNRPEFQAGGSGSDTNVSFWLVPKGTGDVGVKTGNWQVEQAGKGLQVKEGSNCKQGTATLSAGSVVVSNTSVTASSRILLTSNADGGTPGWLRVSARTAGTSFTITSSSGTDTSTVAYQIFEPAP